MVFTFAGLFNTISACGDEGLLWYPYCRGNFPEGCLGRC